MAGAAGTRRPPQVRPCTTPHCSASTKYVWCPDCWKRIPGPLKSDFLTAANGSPEKKAAIRVATRFLTGEADSIRPVAAPPANAPRCADGALPAST